MAPRPVFFLVKYDLRTELCGHEGLVGLPEFGLPLCHNHAYAWKRDLLAFEPETTTVVCVDPVEYNVIRKDLSHLPARPARVALDHAWRLSAIWGKQNPHP